MFQQLSRLNHQMLRFQPQSGPYPPFYQNLPPPDHFNQWLGWDYMRWQPNLHNLPQTPVSVVKIEQSEPIVHYSAQHHETQAIKQQYRQKQTKEDPLLKNDEYDTSLAVQKRAITLAKKGELTFEEKVQLKRYRQMRVQGYLGKKAKRTFQKKIVYTTRKRVADRRIRFKGKFINQYQARQLLALSGTEHTFQELKAMMKDLKSHA